MRKIIAAIGAACVALAGLLAVQAVGQGTGGTLGPKAVGTQVFEVRIKGDQFGLHCPAEQRRRACANRPKLASISSGNAAVYQGGQRVGTAHFANIVTKRRFGELFLATVVLNDGTLTLQGAGQGGENAPSIPSSITGGSGAYAGARGYTTEAEAPGGSQNEFRITVTATFIP